MPPDDKDSAVLPRRIDGCWALIHRPMTPTRIAHVDFLLSRFALLGQAQAYVRSAPRRLVGRQQDWLVAAAHRDFREDGSCSITVYGTRLRAVCIGWAWPLFELENPAKCLLRGDSWIFGPEAEYERPRRCRRCCLSLRIYDGRRRRHASIFTTELPTARLPWLGPVFARCSIGIGRQWKLAERRQLSAGLAYERNVSIPAAVDRWAPMHPLKPNIGVPIIGHLIRWRSGHRNLNFNK
jgi:hypothetical protein